MLRKNINHSEIKSQDAEKVKEKERIEKLKEAFHKAWEQGFRKFIPCRDKSPDVKSINQFLKQQFGKGLKELGINLYDIWELVKKEGKEKEWKEFLEQCITKCRSLALYGGYQEGRNSFLYYIDIDDKENDGKKKDEKLQLILEKFPELGNSLLVETGSGYHIWFLSDVELANLNRKGIELRGEGLYVLFPYSKHPSGKIYEIKSGSFENLVKLDNNSAIRVQEFIESGGDKKQRVKEAGVKLRSRKIESEKKQGKKEVPENVILEVVKELKKKHPVLYKIALCYEGEERYQGGRYGFDRSLFEDDFARAVKEIVDGKGLYFEYDWLDIFYAVHSHLTGGKYKIKLGNGVIKEIETKIQERGERYLNYIRTSVEGREWASRLEFQRQKIRELNEKEIADWIKNGGVKILQTPVGSGKSTTALRLIAELKKKDEIQGTFVYVCKDKTNLEEKEKIADELGLKWREFRGRDETNCKAFQDGSRLKLLEQGLPAMDYCLNYCSFRSECIKSGYLGDFNILKRLGRVKNSEYDVIFTTYDFVIERQDKFYRIAGKLIVDDVDVVVKDEKVSFQEIRRSYKIVNQYEKELIGAGFQIDKVKDVLLKLEQNRNLDEADFSVVGSLKDIFEWLYEQKNEIPCFKIAGLLKAIKEGRAFLEQDGYGFYELKKFRNNFDVLFLGATLNEELIKKALTKKQLKKLKEATKVYGLTNLEIKYYDVKVATSYWGYERKRDEFWNKVYPIVVQELTGRVVIFTYQKIEKELAERIRKDFKLKVWTSDDLEKYLKGAKEIPDDVEVVITHYWGSETKGVNLFERFDKAIFVCLPIRNITEFQRFRKALGVNEATITDDCFNELWQSIGRLRAFLKTSVEVVIIANLQSKIAKSVKKKLEKFEIKDSGEKIGEKIDELYDKSSKILQEMGGIQLFDLLPKEYKLLGKVSSEAISYLNSFGNLKGLFTFFRNGDIYLVSPKKTDVSFVKNFINDLKVRCGLKYYKLKGWRLNIQRRVKGKCKKGSKGTFIEMNLRKIHFGAFVSDLELYRKKLWEIKGILICEAVGEDGEKQFLDNWTFEKLAELEKIKYEFNQLNSLPQGFFYLSHTLATQTQPKISRKELEEKLKEMRLVEKMMKQNKRYNELIADFERKRRSENETLLDYPDIALEIVKIYRECLAKHRAKKLISKLRGGVGYYDSS
jgi:hypothetical protein